jgi:hypothetical protein
MFKEKVSLAKETWKGKLARLYGAYEFYATGVQHFFGRTRLTK